MSHPNSPKSKSHDSFIHSLDAIIWEADAQTLQVRFVSRQATSILGHARERWLSEPTFWQDQMHPDDVERVITACRQLTADSQPIQLEYRMRGADGRYCWLRDHISLICDEGQPVSLRGVKFDLSDHIEADALEYERTKVLREFARIVGATLDHREVLQQSLNQLRRVLAFDTASIYLSSRGEQPEFVAGIGYEDEAMTTHEAQRLLKNSPILAQMAQDLQPVISADVRTLDGWIWVPGAEHTRSFMAVPLIGHDQVMLGTLMIDNKEVGFFKAADLQMVETLAQHMAIAIENAWLYESAQRQLKEKSALLEAGTAVSSSLDLPTILTRLAESIGQSLDVTSVYICDWQPDRLTTTVLAEYYSPAASPNEQISDLGQTYHVLEQFGTSMEWLSNRKPIVDHVTDPHMSELERAHMQKHDAKSILAIPLVVKEEVIGYIELWESRRQREFTSVEITIAQGIAQHAAMALANAQLFAAEARRSSEAELLKGLTIHLTSTLELDEVLARAIDTVRQHITDVQSCAISLLEDDNQFLLTRVSWARQPEYELVPVGKGAPVAETITSRRVLESKQPVTIADLWQMSESNERTLEFQERGLRSILYAPLLINDEPIGILHINFWNQPHYFQPEEITFCQSIANQVAIAIENARLYEEARRSTEELLLLHEIAMATAVTLDIDLLLRQTTQLIVAKVYPHVFGFTLLDPETNILQAHSSFHGLPEEQYDVHIPPHSVAGRVVATGEPFICGDVRQEPLYCQDVSGPRSRIAVPLPVHGRIIGVINAASPEHNAFDDHDLRFLGTLASQVATAIERARLYATLQEQADVLAKRVAERTAELQEEHDRTMAILESAGEGIALTDTQTNIIYANPALERQSGYSRPELIERDASIWLSDQTLESTYRALWAALRDGRSWSGELVSQRKDGTYYDITLILSPVRDAHDDITGYVAVQSDISRLKEVDRLKTKFVANVSHELRTPLTNIKMYLTLLARGRAEKRDHYLHVLNYETDRLTRLIQDLLDLSRLETAAPPDLTAVTDASAALETYYNEYRQQAHRKNLTFSQEIESDLPSVQIEEQHFGQLVTNLLGNAVAYTPAGGVIILKATANDHLAHLQISNSGPGIAAADLPYLFERFYRGKVAQEMAVSGTGLGLAICQEIVERYNGRIEIESNPHHLTTVTVWLPLARLEDNKRNGF